jgi:carbamoyltransferase
VLTEVKNHDNRNFEAALIDCLAKQSKSFPDLASSVQSYLEIQVLSYIEYWKSRTGMTNLAVAGGVFANVKLNQRLIEGLSFEKTYIYPNMGDGGLAPGAVWGSILSSGHVPIRTESMYLGRDYSVGQGLTDHQIDLIVQNIIRGGIVGFFQGRSEWGPRALCHRSIFASPGVVGISKKLNARLKRTDFMPFAPIVLEEFAEEVFDLSTNSHIDNYNNMTATVNVKQKYCEILKEVTNIDGTARPQIVHSDLNDVTAILSKFYQLTGIPALINTSFNTHEEPIVESPESALKLLKNGVLDLLVIGNKLYGPNLDEL